MIVRRACPSANHTKEKKNSSIVQIDSDDDEFEDASESFNVDDDYFVDSTPAKRTEPLSNFFIWYLRFENDNIFIKFQRI